VIGEIRLAMTQIEGEVFKLELKLDKEVNLNNYCKIRKEMDAKKTQHTQYRLVLDEFEKQEQLKKIKRRMMR
jgi:hypothetical protein